MKIEINRTQIIAEVIVTVDNAEIREDLSSYRGNAKCTVPEEQIMMFIKVASELNFFNRKNDVDFIKYIYDELLSDIEREEFKEIINT